MSKSSLITLAMQCRVAAMTKPVGSFWRHYGGDYYEITGYSIIEQSGEVHCNYRPVVPEKLLQHFGVIAESDLDGLFFSRPAAEWQELVGTEVNEHETTTVPRFTRVRRSDLFEPFYPTTYASAAAYHANIAAG